MRPIVVIGAGAAGLMAAISAAAGPRPVVLLESTKDGGRKILISGGGRCNVLPSALSPAQYVTDSSPNTLKKMLLAWPLHEQQSFFEDELGIRLVLERESGKLFPESNRARDVRDALVERVRRDGAEIRFGSAVRDLVAPVDGNPWRVIADTAIDAHAVVIATGGLSVPATGSDGTGLRIVEGLGHTINPTYPALTPLTAEPPRHAPLAGVSVEATLEAPLARGRFVTRGGFLFTHRGYSGPAVLDISHLAVRSRTAGSTRQPILVQWTDLDAGSWDTALRQAGGGQVGPLLRRGMPTRLADTLMQEANVDAQRTLAELRRDERARLVTALARYPLPWTGDEGYKKAEVTGGGVALSEVNPRTLESRLHPGLFLCGEILDAFGPIGGYNFAWAWATGRTAGRGAAARTGDAGA
ncbi:aminoacetone oxidase family FAD-binding enzyme [soil metagenome]